MASNVPLTIQTIQNTTLASTIVIGSNTLSCQYTLKNVYWIVILDRADLSVKANFTFATNNVVPSQLQPFLNNAQYIMILTTQSLATSNLPQGAFYNFLVGEGAETLLNKAEQIYEALNCGTWGWLNYTYVCVIGDQSSSGYEFLDYYNSAVVNTLYFFPITVGNQTLYTPAV
jgi:hypothetical protein